VAAFSNVNAYDVTVMVAPPEAETREGETVGAGAVILRMRTGMPMFLALTETIKPSEEPTSEASLGLPPTITDIRHEENVHPA
jgi:hypothetical protein